MEKHLRTFVNYQHEEWLDKLLMAEFVANNNNFAFTRLSPFFASKGLHLHMIFDIIDLSDISTYERINKKKAIDISEFMQLI